jgi:tRNA-methyltransferase O
MEWSRSLRSEWCAADAARSTRTDGGWWSRGSAVDGLTLTVHGLDAVDGSPVLDVKPYLPEFGPRGEVRGPAWSRELMRNYF